MPADKFMRTFYFGKRIHPFPQLIFGLFQKGGIFGSIGKVFNTKNAADYGPLHNNLSFRTRPNPC